MIEGIRGFQVGGIFRIACMAVWILPLFIHASLLHAEEGSSPEVNLRGDIKFFGSAYTEDNKDDDHEPHEAGDYNLNRGELHLKLDGYISDNVSY